MAKKPRGYRANKPNDTFGVTNQDSLYRGKYRDEVYDDDNEDNNESEEQNMDPANKAAATPEKDNSSFAPQQSKQDDEHDYKKRYDDLKRHYDDKVNEFKSEREKLVDELKTLKERDYQLPENATTPKTVEELQQFKERYPDVFEVVEKVSSLQAEAQLSSLKEEMNRIKEREQELEKQKAYEELLRLHPDFDEIKQQQEFFDWLDAQPESLSNGIYKNNTDAKLAARVIDLYKADNNIGKKKQTKPSKNEDAAASVTKSVAKEVSTSDTNGRIFKASQIAKMKSWEFEKLEAEIDKARSEGRIDYNS